MPDSPNTGPRPFPLTRLSLLEAIAGDDALERSRALEVLVAAYWRPVYRHLRVKWRAEPADAEDLTQEFFARAVAQDFFAGYDPARARFRTFLRTCLDRFASNARRAERRLKRGGGAAVVPLDFDGAERELGLADPGADQDAAFDREWMRSLFSLGVEALRSRCTGTPQAIRFQLFQRYDLDPVTGADRPSYQALATEFDIPVTQVTNHLAWARREFRRLVLERLRALSGSDAEFRDEARELFGVDPA